MDKKCATEIGKRLQALLAERPELMNSNQLKAEMDRIVAEVAEQLRQRGVKRAASVRNRL